MTLIHRPAARRVVVTGLGAVTPLGGTFADSWSALLTGRSGITDLTTALRNQGLRDDQLERELVLSKNLPCQVAAPVLREYCESSGDSRTTARFVQFALLAAREALQQSGLLSSLALDDDGNSNEGEYDGRADSNSESRLRRRTGVCIASGMSSLREVTQAYETLLLTGYRKLSPHFVPKVLNNSASGRVALRYGLTGPNHSCATACAAGTHAIGDAYRIIQSGDADVMLAGGAEAAIDPLGLAGFGRLRALSTSFNDRPESASRPFDRDRDGFVMGEGAAILVLEDLQHALTRGAGSNGNAILAEITGYGLSGDAHHITAPDPQGRGAIRCMEHAIAEHHLHRHHSNYAADESSQPPTRHPIRYVNAHATSTPKGDEIEAMAMGTVFAGWGRVLVSSTKGATGHLLAAAGALEAAFCVQSLVDRWLPPTLNLGVPDVVEESCSNLDFVRAGGNDAGSGRTPDDEAAADDFESVDAVMSNSFGFGGTNASIVLQRWSSYGC
jgi:3-oxoacyl-[acyl-carrier-protein] synthase II